jgi:uncharacterized SAM-binding protein YcdF (DUF218 family)
VYVAAKLFGAFILPPGLFILLLVLALGLLRFRKKKAATAVLLAVAGLLYLLSIEPVKDTLILPLENSFAPLSESAGTGAGMIVILGGGVTASSPEEGGRSSLSPAALKRVYYGARLHKQRGLPVLVSGGQGLRTSETEARVAARVLRELGVPAEKIFEEQTSRNTWENAAAVKRLFSPSRVILVTSAYHMRRSVFAFRRQSIDCLPAPTDYRSQRSGYTFLSFLPDILELMDSWRALKEYTGLLAYRLAGTLKREN